jgi:hypothetical protein
VTQPGIVGRVLVVASLTLCSVVANAVPVTYDFTGTGDLYTYTGTSNTSIHSSQTYTGWVTIDVLAPGPSGDDSYICDGNCTYDYENDVWSPDGYATDYNGWVHSEFFIDWGSGSVSPGPVPGQYDAFMLARIHNASTFDSIYNSAVYGGAVGDTNYTSAAYLDRVTTDPTWLNGLVFDQSLSLAPASAAGNNTNVIAFEDYSFTRNALTGGHDWSGYWGSVSLSSFTARTTSSVPEPGTLGLLGLALAGIGFTRRRRTS